MDILRRPAGQRLEHLDLLVADGVGREVHRRLHRHQAEKLHHVVLDHVADRACGVVIAARPPAMPTSSATVICTEATCRRFQIGSKMLLPNRKARMFWTVSLPR